MEPTDTSLQADPHVHDVNTGASTPPEVKVYIHELVPILVEKVRNQYGFSIDPTDVTPRDKDDMERTMAKYKSNPECLLYFRALVSVVNLYYARNSAERFTTLSELLTQIPEHQARLKKFDALVSDIAATTQSPEALSRGLSLHLTSRSVFRRSDVTEPEDTNIEAGDATECVVRIAERKLRQAIGFYTSIRYKELYIARLKGPYGEQVLPICGARVRINEFDDCECIDEPNAFPDPDSNILFKASIDPKTKAPLPQNINRLNDNAHIAALISQIDAYHARWERASAEFDDTKYRDEIWRLDGESDRMVDELIEVIKTSLIPLMQDAYRKNPDKEHRAQWGEITVTYLPPYVSRRDAGTDMFRKYDTGGYVENPGTIFIKVPGHKPFLAANVDGRDKTGIIAVSLDRHTLKYVTKNFLVVGEPILAYAKTHPPIDVRVQEDHELSSEPLTPILDIGKLEESEARAALFRAIPEHSRPPHIASAEDEQAQPWRALIGDEALQKLIETQSADFWETGPSAFESEWTFQNAAQTFLDFSAVYAQLSTEDPQTFPAVDQMNEATRAACYKRIGENIDHVKALLKDWRIVEKNRRLVSKTFTVAPGHNIPRDGYINAFGIDGDTIAEKSKWISTLEPQLVEVLSDGKARIRYTLPYDASNGKNNVRLHPDCRQIGELQIGLNSQTLPVRSLGEYEYMKSRAQQSQSSPAAAERPRPSPIATVNVLPDDRDGEDEGSILGALGVRSATPAAEVSPIPAGNREEVAAPLSELIATLLINRPDQWRDRLQTGTPDERTLASALIATKCTIEACVDAGLDYERLKATYAAMSDIIRRLAHDEKSKAEITALRKDLKDAMLRIYLSPIVERVLSEDVEIAPLLTLQPENRPMVIAAIMRDLSALPSVMKEHGRSNLNGLGQGYLATETVTSAWKHLETLIS